jgi:hypothetical protein
MVGRDNSSLASTSSQTSSLSIVTLTKDRLAAGAVYRISPDPFTGAGNFTIHDGDIGRDASTVDGVITIQGMPDGTYSVIQVAGPNGQEREIIPRIVTITNSSSESIAFAANLPDRNGSLIESVIYSVKFECGTVRGSEGPLRPGHYDTDIGIFNKQNVPVKMTWSAASNNNEATNAILKTLGSQTSTSIVCNDIQKVLGVKDNFEEGFVLIEVPLDPRLRSSIAGTSTIILSTEDAINILDVQTFYTANALEELPHTVLVDKISFVLHSNVTAGSISESSLGKILDITLPSELGEISDPEQRVRDYLARQYNMTAEESSSITIEIERVDVGVGTMIDDHAISLSTVRPQAKYS